MTVHARKPSCGGMLYRMEASIHTNVEVPISAVTYAFSASVPRAASTKRVMKPFAEGSSARTSHMAATSAAQQAKKPLHSPANGRTNVSTSQPNSHQTSRKAAVCGRRSSTTLGKASSCRRAASTAMERHVLTAPTLTAYAFNPSHVPVEHSTTEAISSKAEATSSMSAGLAGSVGGDASPASGMLSGSEPCIMCGTTGCQIV